MIGKSVTSDSSQIRMQNAFGPSTGYAEGALVDPILLRDQVFPELTLEL